MNNWIHIFDNGVKLSKDSKISIGSSDKLQRLVRYDRCTNKMAKILAFATNEHE